MFAVICLSSVFFPGNWWARYIPHFFLLALIPAVAVIYYSEQKENKMMRNLSYAVLVCLTFNLLVVGGANMYANVVKSQLITRELYDLKKQKDPVVFYFSKTYFQAVRIRLREAGVRFVESTEPAPADSKELRTMYKLDGFGPRYRD